MKKLLVLGVGNLLLTDDGVGVHAVQDLSAEQAWSPEEVDFLDGATFTQDIFYVFQEYERVLVLDSVKGGREPGPSTASPRRPCGRTGSSVSPCTTSTSSIPSGWPNCLATSRRSSCWASNP
jgi:hydrogenase maturation protease